MKKTAAALLLALASGCYGHGRMLGAIVGTSIVTAAIMNAAQPPPPGYAWVPSHWVRDEYGEWYLVRGHWVATAPPDVPPPPPPD